MENIQNKPNTLKNKYIPTAEFYSQIIDSLQDYSIFTLDMLDYLVEWARIKYASDVFSPTKIKLTDYINRVF